jgi:hypothetical protein
MKTLSLYLPWILTGAFFCGLALIWYYRIITLGENFLKTSMKLLNEVKRRKSGGNIFYHKVEFSGIYKGREVFVGIEQTGLRGEFLALPYIQMKLKDALTYNMNRLPHYAFVQKKMVVYKMKVNVFWSIFDKNYPQVFSQSFFIVCLERLLATAEDLERGRLPKGFIH